MPVIVSADPMALAQSMNTGIYGATTDFLRDRLNNMISLGTVSEAFMNSARSMYDQFHGADIMRQVRAVTQQLGGLFDLDKIHYLHDIADFQRAKPIMQRFLMAEPTIREMYLRFEADGYSETYQNIHGNDVGTWHHDYRLIMDGMLVEAPDDELVVRVFYEDQHEEDLVRLTPWDQMDVARSWERMRYFIQQREQDPTSIFCDQF